ncbi:hypothetical protein EC968_008897, partial [Mortierella alpina]
DPDFDEEDYRVDLPRSGKLPLIKELTLTYGVTDDDVEMIAEHCTGLKVLNFDTVNVTAENLAKLIPSNRHQTEDIDVEDRSKRRKTRLTTNLESLSFKECFGVAGATCLDIVSSLGPQLKQLFFEDFEDITDQDMMKVVQRCPNLVSLQLERTSITDEFLEYIAQVFLPSHSTSTPGFHRRHLENLNVNWNLQVSSKGILPVVMTCRSTLKSLSVQIEGGVSDKVLFALVGDLADKTAAEGSKVGPHCTSQSNVLQQTSDKKSSIAHYRFSPNTVLTEIRLSRSVSLTDVGFEVLFRFATELVSIALDASDIGDGALMVLAEMYRNRMNALGMGVPAPWREHVLADERVQAMSRSGASLESFLTASTTVTSAAKDSSTSSDSGVKVFTEGHVPGGLKRLVFSACSNLTNKGLRAIVRSCVGLELLDVDHCPNLTLEFFQGPWACLRLRELKIAGLNLETTPQDLGVVDEELDSHKSVIRTEYLEELVESLRFPLWMYPYPEADDSEEAEFYDHMALYEDEDEDNDDDDDDDDDNVKDVRCYTPRQRAILREFYSKLGQLSQLRVLIMNQGRYCVRVKDGLHLVLPGLQQNLTRWELDLENGYFIGNLEMMFFGKNFGYDYNCTCTDWEEDDEDRLECETRISALEVLVWNARALECVFGQPWAAHIQSALNRFSKHDPMPDPATDARYPTDTSAAIIPKSLSRLNSGLMSSTLPISPFDIPEIASLIASNISKDSDLARCSRVSRSLHDICIPILWKSFYFSNLTDRTDQDLYEEGYHISPYLSGNLSLIEELTITFEVEDEHMEMIVENCAELKTLNFVDAHVTTKNLAVLFPSNCSQLRDIDLDDRSKRRKTWFPSNLESLRFVIFNIFPAPPCLASPPCLEIVSSLGPQLKRLHLEGFDDITDQDMLNAIRRCPNLVELRLNLWCITDDLLINIAEDFLPSDSISTPGLHRQPLERLNLDWCNELSSEGIIPVIVACRFTLKSLSAKFVRSVGDEVLLALVEDSNVKTSGEDSKVKPHFTSQPKVLQQTSDTISIMNHRFSPNTVLTELCLSLTSGPTEVGFE